MSETSGSFGGEAGQRSAKERGDRSDNPVLERYMRDIGQIPILTEQEVRDLASRYAKTRDKQAFDKLVSSNLRFVAKIAFQYDWQKEKIMDLIQEGNVGLMRAVEKFDPRRNVKLLTYAAYWIRAYIALFIRKDLRMVKIGTTPEQRIVINKLSRARSALAHKGVEETNKALAAEIGVKEKTVAQVAGRLASPDLSLDAPVSDESSASFVDFMSAPGLSPEEELSRKQQIQIVSEVAEELGKGLGARDKVFLQERLMSTDPIGRKDIGRRYKITRERARQVERKLLGKIEGALKAKGVVEDDVN